MTVPSRLYGFQTLDLLSATDKCFLAQPHQPGLMAMDKVDIAFLRKTKWHKRVQRGQKIWKHKCIGDISWYLPFPISPEAEMSFLFWPTAPPTKPFSSAVFTEKISFCMYMITAIRSPSLSLYWRISYLAQKLRPETKTESWKSLLKDQESIQGRVLGLAISGHWWSKETIGLSQWHCGEEDDRGFQFALVLNWCHSAKSPANLKKGPAM